MQTDRRTEEHWDLPTVEKLSLLNFTERPAKIFFPYGQTKMGVNIFWILLGNLPHQIKVFKMSLRLVTELYQGFAIAFTCVPRACWMQQSQVCCQKRCPHVWTLPPFPSVLRRWLPAWVPAGTLLCLWTGWDSHGLSALSKHGKEQVVSLVRVICSAELKCYICLPPSHTDGWEMLKITVRTTRMNPWFLQAARNPRNLTSTENTRMDECMSWMDAFNPFFWTRRAVLLSWKHLSFPLSRMTSHRSSFWGHYNTDVWAGQTQ